MEFTPTLQNISEDSGFATGSLTETPFSCCDNSSFTPNYGKTHTTTSSVTSRKRKLSITSTFTLNRKDLLESLCAETSFDNDINASSKVLSSTLNESITKTFEKCNLKSPNCVQSSYQETSSDNELSEKRYKIDDSPNYLPKTRSAPSTPTKHFEIDELHNTKEKSKSEHLNRFNLTPVRNTLYSKARLGSPERIELLYPNIKVTPSPLKLKTPEKLREFLKRINSPAKKRLFESPRHQEEKRIGKRVDHDPISVFFIKNDFRHVVSKIFEYLSDGDLCAVSKVSKTWKRALVSDYKAFPRYYSYSCTFKSNKENILQDVPLCSKHPSPPASPARDSFHRCTRIASQLQPNQSLQKCLRCMEPAVIEGNISQCQNPYCEYIYCTKCLSFSISGPENFVDKCQKSKLLLDKQKITNNSRFLSDVSNGVNNVPSFLLDSPNRTPIQTKYDSSGYLSGNEISPVIIQHLNVASGTQKSILVSRNVNKVEKLVARHRSRKPSVVSVVSSTPKIVETPEPSSPPRREHVACSKQSKKNLKRLQF